MQFLLTATLAALSLSVGTFAAPSALENRYVAVEKRTTITDLVSIIQNLEISIAAPVATITQQLVADFDTVIVDLGIVIAPQANTALTAIITAINEAIDATVIDVIPPAVILSDAELQAVLQAVKALGVFVIEQVILAEIIVLTFKADVLALVQAELQQLLNTIAPFVNPICTFANQAIGVTGTAQTSTTIQIGAITAAIAPIVSIVSVPVSTFIGQTGITQAVAGVISATI